MVDLIENKPATDPSDGALEVVDTGKNYMEAFGLNILQAGYNIIPIRAGTKEPVLKGWSKVVATPESIKQWAKNGYKSIAIRDDDVVVIDIDIDDEGLADEAAALCVETLGGTVIRIGRPPRVSLLYKACFSEEKSEVIKSAAYDYTIGLKKYQIEILSKGRCCIAYGIHPATQKPYSWYYLNIGQKASNGQIPIRLYGVKKEQLATVTKAQINNFIRKFDEFCASQGNRQPVRKFDAPNTSSSKPAEYIEIPTLLANIAMTLENTNPDLTYADWIRVGVAIYNETKGRAEDEGLELWKKFCARGSKFVEGEPESKWQSFEVSSTEGSTVGIKTLHYLARMYPMPKTSDDVPLQFDGVLEVPQGSESLVGVSTEYDRSKITGNPKTLEEFLHSYVYCMKQEMIINRFDLVTINESALKRFHDNDTYEVPEAKADKVILKKYPLYPAWRFHKEALKVTNAIYKPNAPEFIKGDGDRLYYNTFRMPQHTPVNLSSEPIWTRVKLFIDHIEYLIPNRDESEWFLDWMAYCIKQPAERCNTTPLHVTPKQGTGRSWLGSLFPLLLGESNVSKTTFDTLLNSSFNSFMDDKLVCIIDEVSNPGSRNSVSGSLRSKLTDPKQEINNKYKNAVTKDVYVNFLLFSNDLNALNIPKNDRRMYVMAGATQPLSPAYYARLFNMLKDKLFISGVYYYLRSRDLSKFQHRRAPMTKTKKLMMGLTESPTESAFNLLCDMANYEVTNKNATQEEIDAYYEANPIRALTKAQIHHKVGEIIVNEFEYSIDRLNKNQLDYCLKLQDCQSDVRKNIFSRSELKEGDPKPFKYLHILNENWRYGGVPNDMLLAHDAMKYRKLTQIV